ncbi:MAG: PEP-CTERM sorting domain-containing protein [Planctomycetota bacterium]
MTRQLRFIPVAAALAALLGVSHAHAVTYIEVFSEADAAGGANRFLDSVTVDGGIAYAVQRDLTTGPVNGGEVVAFDGSTFTTIMDTADWAAGTGPNNDPSTGFGTGIIGGTMRAISAIESFVFEVDLGTGATTIVATRADLTAASGEAASATIPSIYDVAPNGDIYALNDAPGIQEQLLKIDGATNAVSIEIDGATLETVVGGTQNLDGLAVSGGKLYIGSDASDSIVSYDLATGAVVTELTDPQIAAVTDVADIGGFRDFFAAPDGKIYFYETTSDHILSFDPADPTGTIATVISEADLIAGPAGSDAVNQLAWWDGNLAWTRSSNGFYAIIPEPASALLAAIAGVGVLARRR